MRASSDKLHCTKDTCHFYADEDNMTTIIMLIHWSETQAYSEPCSNYAKVVLNVCVFMTESFCICICMCAFLCVWEDALVQIIFTLH